MNDASEMPAENTTEPAIVTTHKNMSPLTVSLEWWSNWSDRLGIAAVIFGAVLAVVTALGWGFSWKSGKLKDAALEKYKADSNERISSANADAAEANKMAAQANERAAQANERAAALEKEAAVARLELEKIKERQAPRAITSAQESTILAALGDGDRSGVHICFEIDTGADDADEFGNAVGRVLARAGYRVLPMARPMTGNVSRDITISPTESPEAVKLVDAFKQAGLKATNIRSGSHLYLPGYSQEEPPGTITFTIGRRSDD